MTGSPPTDPPWLETPARVTACKYEFGAGQALAFGIPVSKHFLITFAYYAYGKTYTGEFTSPTYLEQGQTFPVSYNPLNPQQNSKSDALPSTRASLFTLAIGGSVVLSILFLVWMRGCK